MTDRPPVRGHGADLVPRIQAAAELGISPEALSRAARSGEIRTISDPKTRRVYFHVDEIAAYKQRLADGSVVKRTARGHYPSTRPGMPRALTPIKERLRRSRPGVEGKWTKRWKARYRDAGGKVMQIGIFPTRSAAEDATQAYVAELIQQGPPPADGLITIGQLRDNWPNAGRVDASTASTNRERLDRVIARLEYGRNTPFREVTPPIVDDVQGRLLESGLSKVTVDGSIGALSTLWKDAAAKGYVVLADNPAAGVRVNPNDRRLNPVRRQRKHRAVALDELCAFAIELDPEWTPLALFPRVTNVRPGELPVVNMRKYDRDQQMLRVDERLLRSDPKNPRQGTKTDRPTPDNDNPGRWVPLPIAHVDWLLEARPVSLDGYPFRTPSGTFYSIGNFYRDVWNPAMDKAVANAGIVRFDLVDLRHSFASYLHAAGVPDADIMAWMGHKDPRSATKWRDVPGVGHDFVDVSTSARVYRHSTNESLEFALAVLTDTIDAIREAIGHPQQLSLLSDEFNAEPVPSVGDRARAYAANPRLGLKDILGEELPLKLHARVPITIEIASMLTSEAWQSVIDAYSPPTELKRQLRAIAPTGRGAKRAALLEAAADYRAAHGHLRVPRTFVTGNGLALGKFIQNQRKALRGTTSHRLTPEQLRELDQIDPGWRDGAHVQSPTAELGSTAGARPPKLTVVEDPPETRPATAGS
jgi:integrase